MFPKIIYESMHYLIMKGGTVPPLVSVQCSRQFDVLDLGVRVGGQSCEI